MKVLIACEFSGIVRDAFAARGHDAWSCDLLPTERPGQHIVGDIRDVIGRRWDMLLAFAPCRFLCNSGVRWLDNNGARWAEMIMACEFFNHLLGRDLFQRSVARIQFSTNMLENEFRSTARSSSRGSSDTVRRRPLAYGSRTCRH